jgi:hypothetical protein
MSTWYNAVVDDLSEVVNAIAYFESELVEAKAECRITGTLSRASSSLPGITEHRFNQLQEIEAILEHLNILLRKKRSETFRKFLEKYNRQLSSRDAEKYVDGDPDVIDLTMIVNQVSLMRNKYLGILKGLETKQWQIGHITRLHVAGMEDVAID